MEKLYLNILNSMNKGVIFADNDHIIRYMDDTAREHVKAMVPFDVIGKNLMDFHRDESKVKIEEYHEQMKRGELERVYARKSHQYELYMVAVRDEERNLLGYAEVLEEMKVIPEVTPENSYAKSFRHYDKIQQKLLGNTNVDYIVEQVGRDKKVLEILSSTGEVGIALAYKGNEVLGIDHREHMVNITNRKIVASYEQFEGKYKTVNADYKSITLDDQYDIIILNYNVLNYLFMPKVKINYLKKLKEHLLPGGKMIIQLDTLKNGDITAINNIVEDTDMTIDELQIHRQSEVVRLFEKQNIIHYKTSYNIKGLDCEGEAVEYMRQSIMDKALLEGMLKEVNMQIVDDYKITWDNSETIFETGIYSCE